MSSQDYAQVPARSPSLDGGSAPGSPVQQPYRVSRPLSPAMSPTNSETNSLHSGTPNPQRGGFYRGTSIRSGMSLRSSSFMLNTSAYTRPYKSRRIEPGTATMPWTQKKKTKAGRAVSAIPMVGLIAGLIIVAIYAYTGWSSYSTADFCPYWEDDFSNGLDESVWTRQVQLDGFGTSEFEWTTPYENNSFVQDGILHIHPSLSWVPATDGTTLNLTTMGICTGNTTTECSAVQNSTAGTTIPPVQSARLNTKISKYMKYGKLEVKAKMPVGDWLWPAIWMMPVDSVYGVWPASGEIDIAESRGNDRSYYSVVYDVNQKKHNEPAGNNAVGSTLHWGPNAGDDAYPETTNGFHYPSSIDDLTSGYHTYGMEWTPNGIRTYVDQQLTQIAYFKFPSSGFWNLGGFPSSLVNPWYGGSKSSPFDQDFYLILNVAVGGTNGYFADRIGDKPWSNGLTRDEAMTQFRSAQNQWYASWTQPDLMIDSVKMWKMC